MDSEEMVSMIFLIHVGFPIFEPLEKGRRRIKQ